MIAWRLACFERQRCGILANSEKQAASNLFECVCQVFRHSPALQGYIPREEFQTLTLRVPMLDNTATCYPANHRTIQGIKFTCLACDELHASDDHGKAWTFASQQTEAVNAQALVSSQAGMPTNFNPVWRMYQAREKPHIFFDYRDRVALPWSKARAEQAKEELLPLEFEYLWRNQWGATGGHKLFPTDLVEKAVEEWESPETAEAWETLWQSWFADAGDVVPIIGVGLDRAGVSMHGDRSVWSVVARFDLPMGEPIYKLVRQIVFPTGAEAEITEEDASTREIFGHPDAVVFEKYGSDDLAEKVDEAELKPPSAPRQRSIYLRLMRLFKEGRFKFPPAFDMFKEELLRFEYNVERGDASEKFGTQSGHDDTVYAAAWAVDAAASIPVPNVFMQVL